MSAPINRGPRIFTLADLQKREKEKEELANLDALSISRQLIRDSIVNSQKNCAFIGRMIVVADTLSLDMQKQNQALDTAFQTIKQISSITEENKSGLAVLKEQLLESISKDAQQDANVNSGKIEEREVLSTQTVREDSQKINQIEEDLSKMTGDITSLTSCLARIESKNQSWFSKSVDWVKKKFA